MPRGIAKAPASRIPRGAQRGVVPRGAGGRHRIAPVEDAPREAALLGPWGGWVDEQGKVHGANDAWIMPIAAAGSSSKPASTLVYLVNAPVPVSKMSSVAGEPHRPVQDAFARAELTAVEPASTPCTRRCTGTSLR